MPRPPARRSGESVPSEAVLRKIRIPLVRRAGFSVRGEDEEVFVVDMGVLGVFIERNDELPVGELVEIRFPLPGNEIPIRATCRVAWFHAPGTRLASKALPAGLGLEFTDMTEADRARLRAHVIEYLRRHPGIRRFHRQRAGEEGFL